MRLLLDFLCSVAQASGSTAKIDLVWKYSLLCFRHTHGASFIKLSVDFILKVYVGTKARFCLCTKYLRNLSEPVQKMAEALRHSRVCEFFTLVGECKQWSALLG